jgi:hypothetical protein
MKRVDKIRIILLGPLAAYIVYVTITESWTKTDNIVMIICLAATLIDSSVIAAIRKRMRHKE